jgi:hypothetical protein
MENKKDHDGAGSLWHRWEPHVHAPGTVLNDQFGGAGSWDDYLTALEVATPSIRALGITDYYNLETYNHVLSEKLIDRLPQCDLIFPNIEMRLALGTVKGSWVNLHLLVCPDDPNHIEEIQRFLSRLTFNAFGDKFSCNPDDLVRLGQKANPAITDRKVALRHGSEQFKVSFEQLTEEYRASVWAEANILIAVAGGSNDGTSGLRDAADTTLRQEVERFAHIIFSSNPSQKDFWLGRKSLDAAEIRRRYDTLKPCLHGSDGHTVGTAGVPDEDRFSWIKGALIFDALRQACIDPASRAHVGDAPPISAMPSQVISSVTISGASWAKTPKIDLNPGLIAIIGARGSGKTALADIIAAGCDALPGQVNPQSFLHRAREFLADATVQLDWQDGEPEIRSLNESDIDFEERYPRARYLSQQFVEDLCASDGMTDALLREIERVIFEAHDVTAKDGAVDFDDLLELRATRHRKGREREEASLSTLSERIGTEIEKSKLVASYKVQVNEKALLLARLNSDRTKLVAKGSEERVARLGALTSAAERVRNNVRYFHNQEQELLTMQDEVANFRTTQAPETLRQIQQRHASSGLKGDDWAPFLVDYKGDVDKVIVERLTLARGNSAGWKGSSPAAPSLDVPLIPPDATLEQQTLALLEAEIARLQQLISVDRDTTLKFTALSKRIVEEADALNRLKEKLTDCEGAKDRIVELVNEREASYIRVFQAVLAEQQVLADLYAPIRARLDAAGGTLGKLSFSVARVADVERWADEGEKLLDLRKQGAFRGRGTLRQVAEEGLKWAWERGDANSVLDAMKKFRETHQEALLEHSPFPKTEQTEYRTWSKRFAQWLYGTGHIAVRYSVDYDSVDIRKLSPGTRGIVLLLLYLALDDADDRPLIIDQPEENLDPKSIFDELVSLFLAAKSKRQVIMVTHNANLVINTDADQIIIAGAGPHVPDDLPPITYLSGGLENENIRKAVCDILEGGEVAFQERARRLRVRLKR